jgi:hypothetical protein
MGGHRWARIKMKSAAYGTRLRVLHSFSEGGWPSPTAACCRAQRAGKRVSALWSAQARLRFGTTRHVASGGSGDLSPQSKCEIALHQRAGRGFVAQCATSSPHQMGEGWGGGQSILG